MYLESTAPYPMGTVLEITLSLPGLKTALQLKGQVIYINNSRQQLQVPGMGIQFIDLHPERAAQLTSYIESYLSDFLPVTPMTTDKGAGIDPS